MRKTTTEPDLVDTAGPIGGDDRDPALDRFSEAVARLLEVPVVVVSTIDGDRQRFRGACGLTSELDATTAAFGASPYCRRVASSRRPIIVHDTRRRTVVEHDVLGAVGYAGFPLPGAGDGSAAGVLAAVDRCARKWTTRDIAVLRALAPLGSALLARAPGPSTREVALEKELARTRAERELWQRTTAAIAGATDDGEAIERALGELVRHLGVDDAELVTVDGGQVYLRAAVSRDRSTTWPLRDDRLLVEAAAARGSISGSTTGPRGVTIGLVVPLAGGPGAPRYLRVLGTHAPDVASDLCGRFATLLAGILDRDGDGVRARRTAELEVTSVRDDLTGLLNRRGFHVIAEQQLALARRRQLSGMLLFLDLDGLKATNDRAGHAAGDEMLRAAAAVLSATFRDADTIGRLGGDEFGVFSVDTVVPDVVAIRARLAAQVAGINSRRDPAMPLSWSIGAIPFQASGDSTLAALLAEGDRRMYEAKRSRAGEDPPGLTPAAAAAGAA